MILHVIIFCCHFSQDNLVTHCSQLMKETINSQTVCQYYTAAKRYGETELETKCIEWLERGLTSIWTVSLLKEIRFVCFDFKEIQTILQ